MDILQKMEQEQENNFPLQYINKNEALELIFDQDTHKNKQEMKYICKMQIQDISQLIQEQLGELNNKLNNCSIDQIDEMVDFNCRNYVQSIVEECLINTVRFQIQQLALNHYDSQSSQNPQKFTIQHKNLSNQSKQSTILNQSFISFLHEKNNLIQHYSQKIKSQKQQNTEIVKQNKKLKQIIKKEEHQLFKMKQKCINLIRQLKQYKEKSKQKVNKIQNQLKDSHQNNESLNKIVAKLQKELQVKCTQMNDYKSGNEKYIQQIMNEMRQGYNLEILQLIQEINSAVKLEQISSIITNRAARNDHNQFDQYRVVSIETSQRFQQQFSNCFEFFRQAIQQKFITNLNLKQIISDSKDIIQQYHSLSSNQLNNFNKTYHQVSFMIQNQQQHFDGLNQSTKNELDFDFLSSKLINLMKQKIINLSQINLQISKSLNQNQNKLESQNQNLRQILQRQLKQSFKKLNHSRKQNIINELSSQPLKKSNQLLEQQNQPQQKLSLREQNQSSKKQNLYCKVQSQNFNDLNQFPKDQNEFSKGQNQCPKASKQIQCSKKQNIKSPIEILKQQEINIYSEIEQFDQNDQCLCKEQKVLIQETQDKHLDNVLQLRSEKPHQQNSNKNEESNKQYEFLIKQIFSLSQQNLNLKKQVQQIKSNQIPKKDNAICSKQTQIKKQYPDKSEKIGKIKRLSVQQRKNQNVKIQQKQNTFEFVNKIQNQKYLTSLNQTQLKTKLNRDNMKNEDQDNQNLKQSLNRQIYLQAEIEKNTQFDKFKMKKLQEKNAEYKTNIINLNQIINYMLNQLRGFSFGNISGSQSDNKRNRSIIKNLNNTISQNLQSISKTNFQYSVQTNKAFKKYSNLPVKPNSFLEHQISNQLQSFNYIVQAHQNTNQFNLALSISQFDQSKYQLSKDKQVGKITNRNIFKNIVPPNFCPSNTINYSKNCEISHSNPNMKSVVSKEVIKQKYENFQFIRKLCIKQKKCKQLIRKYETYLQFYFERLKNLSEAQSIEKQVNINYNQISETQSRKIIKHVEKSSVKQLRS